MAEGQRTLSQQAPVNINKRRLVLGVMMFLKPFLRTGGMMLCTKLTMFFDHRPLAVLRSASDLECFSVLLILMRDGRSGQGTLLDRF